MKVGNLIRVKEGCGSEGHIGVILELGNMFWTIGFPDGVKDVNVYWIEVIDGTQPN